MSVFTLRLLCNTRLFLNNCAFIINTFKVRLYPNIYFQMTNNTTVDPLDFASSLDDRIMENGQQEGRQYGYQRGFRQGFRSWS